MIYRSILVLSVLTLSAAAQKKPTPLIAPDRWPISSITVDGNQNYTKEQVLAVTGLKIGQLAGREEFEAARDRLVATGVFETVGYRFFPAANAMGFAASFQVVEVQPVYPVRFEDLNVPDEKLKAYLKSKDPLFGPKIPSTKEVLDRYVNTIQELVNEKVTGILRPVGPNQFTIVFRPARSAPAVAQVNFQGNEAVDTQALQKAISGVAVGVSYTEPRFRELLDTSVRPLYEARGRIRVAFPKIATEKAKDVEGLVINVTVEEGPTYELDEVRVTGSSVVPAGESMKTAALKTGEVVNFDEIAQGVERLKRRLRRQGYMRAGANVERKINEKRKTVDLLIRLDEGPQFTFGKLNLEGVDIHGEAAIKKLWAMKEGKPFNADYPDFFLNRIREDGLFDDLGKTSAKVDIHEENHTADVTLRFGAAPREPDGTSPSRRERREP